MKHILLVLILAIIFVWKAQAQSELQFNQVVLLTFTTPNGPYTSPLYTVPTGTVWKIESVGGPSGVQFYELNGVRQAQQLNSSGTFGGNVPVWLPAGTTMKFYNGGSTTIGCYVSIIEFNVVQ